MGFQVAALSPPRYISVSCRTGWFLHKGEVVPAPEAYICDTMYSCTRRVLHTLAGSRDTARVRLEIVTTGGLPAVSLLAEQCCAIRIRRGNTRNPRSQLGMQKLLSQGASFLVPWEIGRAPAASRVPSRPFKKTPHGMKRSHAGGPKAGQDLAGLKIPVPRETRRPSPREPSSFNVNSLPTVRPFSTFSLSPYSRPSSGLSRASFFGTTFLRPWVCCSCIAPPGRVLTSFYSSQISSRSIKAFAMPSFTAVVSALSLAAAASAQSFATFGPGRFPCAQLGTDGAPIVPAIADQSMCTTAIEATTQPCTPDATQLGNVDGGNKYFGKHSCRIKRERLRGWDSLGGFHC